MLGHQVLQVEKKKNDKKSRRIHLRMDEVFKSHLISGCFKAHGLHI